MNYLRCLCSFLLLVSFGLVFADEGMFENVEFETSDSNNNPIKIKSSKGSHKNGVYKLLHNELLFITNKCLLKCDSGFALININTLQGFLKKNVRIVSTEKRFVVTTDFAEFDLNKKSFAGPSHISISFKDAKINGDGFRYDGVNFTIDKNVRCVIN